MRNHISKAIVIEFNGVRFRRYPESRHAHIRNYYWPGISARKKGAGALHVEIYKALVGPIPEGYDVHHKDGDTLNNDPSNLELLTREQHIHHHFRSPARLARARKHIETIRPLAAAWHGSAAGLEFHRENGRKVWSKFSRDLRRTILKCEQCGTEFETTTTNTSEARFCSNKCKSAWRRASGIDDEDRTCAHCGTPFRANKYDSTRCCSKKCAWKIRRLKSAQ